MSDQIIIIFPYRFREFDRKRFEVEYLKKHANVIVYELIDCLHKHFTVAYHQFDKSNDVIRPSSIFVWRKLYLENLKSHRGQTYVINFVPPSSFKELFVNYVLSSSEVFLLKYNNPGLPTQNNIKKSFLSKVREKYFFIRKRGSFKWAYKSINIRFIRFFYPILSRKSDFVLGVHNGEQEYATNFVNANSFDYSMFLKQNREIVSKDDNQDTIIFIDSGGPLFKTDSFMYNVKHTLSKELWYPALVSFFNIIENKTGKKVVIAAHPKHKYSEEDGQYFGSRQIVHDNTMEMISKASFVITLNSTAISYAVMCNKPVLFLLSNEILEDGNDLLNMVETYANILGSSTINIDKFDEELTINLSVNSEKYLLFKKNYLSSRLDKKTNGEIIIDIMSTRKNVLSKISHQ